MSKRFLFLLCCLGLSGLLVAGCGDDNGDDGGEPDATIDMTGDSDTDTGCTDAECAAMGQVCNMTSGMCEDPGDGTCEMANGLCDPAVAQPAEFVCVEDGEGGGICATPCSDTQPCAAGAFCSQGGFCVESECSHFFDNDCPAGEKCIPQPNQSWICTTQGAGMEGAMCEGFGECADGLLCIGGTCQAPDCTPMTNIQACMNAGDECSGGIGFGEGDLIDLGFCTTPCTAFVSNSGCEDGQWCQPANELPANATEFTGDCVDSQGGTAAPGDVCDVNDTSPGVTCGDPSGDPPQPSQICINFGEQATCEQMCDPAAGEGEDGSCPTGEACFEQNLSLNMMPFTPAWGLCETTCDPWAGLGNGGCGMDEFCFPDFNDASIGTCTAMTEDPMPAMRGEDCDFDDMTADIHECSDGLFCVGGVCEVPCDVGAMGMEGGQCEEAEEFCSQLSLDGTQLDIGVCQVGCTYAHGDRFNPTVACPEMDQVCQMSELFGSPSDICSGGYSDDLPNAPLDEFDDCPAGTDFTFCRPGGLCIDLDGITDGLQCVEVCSFAEGQQGSTNHPDCTRSEASCQGGFLNPELGLGVCGNAG